MKVIEKQSNSKMCFICGMDNPIGLKAQFYTMEDRSVMTCFRYKKEHQSFPQRVHGGLVGTMLDELGLRAIWAKASEDVFGVTVSMDVKYRKPVPYEKELIGRGIVIKETPLFAIIKSEIYEHDRTLLAEAELKYMKLRVEQIAAGADAHEEMCYHIKDDITEIDF